jgi:hypothetical protein
MQNCDISMPVVLYGFGFESWSVTWRLLVNRILRHTPGAQEEEVAGEWRQLHDEELQELYSPHIIRVTKSSKMKLTRHVACMGKK